MACQETVLYETRSVFSETEAAYLRKFAKAKGWTRGKVEGRTAVADLCPACSAKKRKAAKP
jgi:hypothetical protein